MQVEGATFLITGASRGIGRALAETVLAAGGRAVISARTAAALEDAADAWAASGRCASVCGDVGRAEDARRMVAEAERAFGGIDVLVNNAAILAPPASVVETPLSAWEDTLRVNVLGCVHLIQAALPLMAAAGRGAIVNLSSTWGRTAAPRVASYCASKFAVEALTQSLAGELPSGVVAIAVNPGVIATDMLASAFEGDVSAYPTPDSLGPAWLRLFAGLDASWNGRSVDLADV